MARTLLFGWLVAALSAIGGPGWSQAPPPGKDQQRFRPEKLWNKVLFFDDDKKLLVLEDARGFSFLGGNLTAWDVETGESLPLPGSIPRRATDISLSADQRRLAVAGRESLGVFELPSGKLISEIKIAARACCLSPEGKTVAALDRRSTESIDVQVWSVVNKELSFTLKNAWNEVKFLGGGGALAFSPDGKILASGGDDGTLKLWDVTKGELIKELKGHMGFIAALAFSPDGKYLASGGDDEIIRVWDVATRKLVKKSEEDGSIYALAFVDGGQTVAALRRLKIIEFWHWQSENMFREMRYPGATLSLGFSRDGKTIAWGGQSLETLDVASRKIKTRSP
jgi:WD40 repeat protein